MTTSTISPARRSPRWAFAAGLALAGTLFAVPARGAEPASVDRPDPPGTITEVRVGIFVMDLASIDDASQTFSADFFLIRRWRDPRLAFEEPSGSEAVRVLPAAEVWNPEIQILNRRDMRVALPEQVRVSPDGSVLHRQRYQGTLASPLDLKSFPFDRQRLPIQVASLQEADQVAL